MLSKHLFRAKRDWGTSPGDLENETCATSRQPVEHTPGPDTDKQLVIDSFHSLCGIVTPGATAELCALCTP